MHVHNPPGSLCREGCVVDVKGVARIACKDGNTGFVINSYSFQCLLYRYLYFGKRSHTANHVVHSILEATTRPTRVTTYYLDLFWVYGTPKLVYP